MSGQLETQCSIWTGWPDGCSVLAGWSFPIAVSGWSAHCYPSGFPVHLAQIKQNLIKISNSGHVEIWGCQFRFWFRMVTSNAASGYVAKISMLRLNIGSSMLRLSSCMLSSGLGPKCEEVKRAAPPPLPLKSLANAEHA